MPQWLSATETSVDAVRCLASLEHLECAPMAQW